MLKQEDVDKVAIADPTVMVALRFRDLNASTTTAVLLFVAGIFLLWG
jgi:hypothetical protein